MRRLIPLGLFTCFRSRKHLARDAFEGLNAVTSRGCGNSIGGPQQPTGTVRSLLMYLALSSISSATGVAPLSITTKASSCISGTDVTCRKANHWPPSITYTGPLLTVNAQCPRVRSKQDEVQYRGLSYTNPAIYLSRGVSKLRQPQNSCCKLHESRPPTMRVTLPWMPPRMARTEAWGPLATCHGHYAIQPGHAVFFDPQLATWVH
ncbi:hypothetical protein BJV78DRAFT_437530 [Lactifluus subvellereus]|nr:hypothetical protein BJV78DRAFT_437530 [Lactifluus subvellereus]